MCTIISLLTVGSLLQLFRCLSLCSATLPLVSGKRNFLSTCSNAACLDCAGYDAGVVRPRVHCEEPRVCGIRWCGLLDLPALGCDAAEPTCMQGFPRAYKHMHVAILSRSICGSACRDVSGSKRRGSVIRKPSSRCVGGSNRSRALCHLTLTPPLAPSGSKPLKHAVPPQTRTTRP